MLLLMIISIAGLILSAATHFCTILHIYNPPRELITFVNLGVVTVIYPAIITSKKMCDKGDVKNIRKAIFNACPRWMSVLTGFLIIYALGGLVFFIFKRYLVGSMVTNEEGAVGDNFQGFSGHLMAFYALAFIILYSCRSLKKNGKIT